MSRARVSDSLLAELGARVASGSYPPGARLDESELAAEFSVSRTPVREVLIALATEGLVELRPRRGAVVPVVPVHRVLEMFEVLAELSALGARLAARRGTPVDIELMRDCLAACADAAARGSADEYAAANGAFHKAVRGAGRSSFLGETADALSRRLGPYLRLRMLPRGRVGESLGEHEAMLDAVASGDGELAASIAREHALAGADFVSDLASALPGPIPRR